MAQEDDNKPRQAASQHPRRKPDDEVAGKIYRGLSARNYFADSNSPKVSEYSPATGASR